MADFAIRWGDFSGGDFGETDPAMADKNQYRGTNVLVYESGLLGPRAGAKQLGVTGLPAHTTSPGPYGFGVFGSYLLIAIDRLYRIPMVSGTPAAEAYAAYPSTVTSPVTFAQAADTLYSLVAGVVYKHTGLLSTPISTPVPFTHLVQWEQWLIGVDETKPWRLFFTFLDPAGPNFDSWPVNNFLDIGSNHTINALLPIFNTLYVGKPNGWSAVSGVLGVQASVRAVANGNGPKDARLCAVTTDNRIIYWPNEQVPTFFNGDRVRPASRYKMRQAQTTFPSPGVIVTPTGQKLMLAGDSDVDNNATDLYVYNKGAWSYHSFATAIGGLVPNDVRNASAMPSDVVFSVRNSATVGAVPVISSIAHTLDRPAHTDDEWASPSDPGQPDLVAGEFTLPAYYDGQGRQVLVKAIIVQFRKWTSGVPGSLNRITCAVTPAGRYERSEGFAVDLKWEEPSEFAEDGGVNDSFRWSLGNQGQGNGFVISFPVLAGCAIREVVAICDVAGTQT